MAISGVRKINQLVNFIKESRAELNRVTWPTREAIIGGTMVVILVSLILVIYMGVVDFIVTKILGFLMAR